MVRGEPLYLPKGQCLLKVHSPDVDLSKEHRYIRLPHPRTGLPQLYLPYTAHGRENILEVVKINCAHRRTWFIGDSKVASSSGSPIFSDTFSS